MFRASVILVLSLALAACGRDAPKPPKMSEVLPNVPLPPKATFVSRLGGADAVQITVRSPERADLITAYYRNLFQQGGWRLVNDAKDQEGAVVFFAEQNGPPIWVRIRDDAAGGGTLVEISGARLSRVPSKDTTKAPVKPSS